MYGDLLERLRDKIVAIEQPEKIVLFGSRAKGETRDESDFDLLVISQSQLPRYQREARLSRALFGSGVAFDLLVFTPEELERRLRAGGSFTREILSTGKTIYERHAA